MSGREKEPPGDALRGVAGGSWRRRTLPPGRPGSTIRAAGLNGRVRDGNGCFPRALVTSNKVHGSDEKGSRASGVGLPLAGRLHVSMGRRVSGTSRYAGAGSFQWTPDHRESCLMRVMLVKPLGHLVRLGCTCHHASTCRLSTCSSRTALLRASRPGSAHLEVGFPLRCFQRLSLPDVATRRCPWRDNRYTRGQSIPVLSY